MEDGKKIMMVTNGRCQGMYIYDVLFRKLIVEDVSFFYISKVIFLP